jgi:uncharacterized protein (DUF433 family)
MKDRTEEIPIGKGVKELHGDPAIKEIRVGGGGRGAVILSKAELGEFEEGILNDFKKG